MPTKSTAAIGLKCLHYPGHVPGRDQEDALKNAKEAIELHLKTLREDGQELPAEDSYRVAVNA